MRPGARRGHQRASEDLLGPRGQRGRTGGWGVTTRSLWREGCPRFPRGPSSGDNGGVPGTGHPNSWAPREGTLGSAGSTCSACRRCAKGSAASYLLCASSTVEPEAGLCVPCGSVCPSTTAAQSTAPAPARPGPARPGRSTPRQGEGRWARGLGWAGRPLKLGALGSGRASSPS